MKNSTSKNIFRFGLTLVFVYIMIVGLVMAVPAEEELYFTADYPPPALPMKEKPSTTLNTIDENGVELHSVTATAPSTTVAPTTLPPTTTTTKAPTTTTTAVPEPEPIVTEPPVPVTEVTRASGGVWDILAECETGGNWAHPPVSIGYSGGLMFHYKTWNAMGGNQFASQAYLATREQQIIIAEKLLADAGNYSPWPGCRRKLGLP